MEKLQGIHIPQNEDDPCTIATLDHGDYRAIQHQVGGTFECLDLDRPECTMFLNEEGKINGSELNRRATLLLWVHDSRFRQVDAIYGDALILGRPDDEGATQTVPAELVDLLFNTSNYRYLVQTADGPSWNGNGLTFKDWVAAYNAALSLADRWALVREVSVVPVK